MTGARRVGLPRGPRSSAGAISTVASRVRRARPAEVWIGLTVIVLLWSSPLRATSVTEHLEALQIPVLEEPAPAPALALEGVDARPISLDALRGSVVLLNFWATWCVPCREEMPAMERLHREYRDRGLKVVAVNLKESRSDVQAFLKKFGLTFLAVLDPDGIAARRFAVRGLPVTFLIWRDGKILWKVIGPREWDSPHTRAYLEEILKR